MHLLQHSIYNKDQRSHSSHWLDRSIPKYGETLVNETKAVLRIVILYIPVPFYWSLGEQTGSRFTIQATNMNGVLPFFTIKPDQFQVVYPVMVIVLVPIFQYFVYPLLKRIGIWKPLHIMTIGGLIAATSFLMAGFLEMRLEKTNAVLPRSGECQLRIYNPFECDFLVKTHYPGHEQFVINSMDFIKRDISLLNYATPSNRVQFISNICPNITSDLVLTDNQAISYMIQTTGFLHFKENVKKSVNGKHLLRILSADSNQSISLIDTNLNQVFYEDILDINLQIPLLPSDYTVIVNGERIMQVEVLPGGVSNLLMTHNPIQGSREPKLITITPPNNLHIVLQLPQYICMAVGDIMFAITGLAFTYSEAPASLKTVMQSYWLLTLAMGNGIDMAIVAANLFNSQV